MSPRPLSRRPLSFRQRACRAALDRLLAGLRLGEVRLRDGDGERLYGAVTPACHLRAEVEVRDPEFYPAVLFGQSAGAGRAYIAGWWGCDDLVALMRIFARNEATLRRWTGRVGGWLLPAQQLYLWARRNTRAGARRNIAAHYDQGDDFFATFLDQSLTYSCAVFAPGQTDLAAAQRAKLELVCRKLALTSADRVLEIGSGWGSFALHAAAAYGCRVTTTTISAAQARHVRELVRRRGLSDRVEVREQDYRDLTGGYDKLVSIEMIEAVGARHYDTFFRRCAGLLDDDGAMLLQTIVVDDRHFRHDARHVDFIKRYIFPGGVLPSISVLARSIARASDLQIAQLEDLTSHYALTLRCWRQRLLAAAARLRELGYDQARQRCWEFYFAYCEGGFLERRVGNVQMLLVKPGCRALPALAPQAPPAARLRTQEVYGA